MRGLWYLLALQAILVAVLISTVPASAQSVPKHYLSAATNNSTLVLGRASVVKMIHAHNTTIVTYYLKLYNKATAPVCGTDVPVMTIPVPPSAASPATGAPPVALPIADGLKFSLGVGFCLVLNLADNDNTAAATGVAINIGVSAQ